MKRKGMKKMITRLTDDARLDFSRQIMAATSDSPLIDVRHYGITIDGTPVAACSHQLMSQMMLAVLFGVNDSIAAVLRVFASQAKEIPMEDGDVGPRLWELNGDTDDPIWFEEFFDGNTDVISVFHRSDR